jgi:hypothetical protein
VPWGFQSNVCTHIEVNINNNSINSYLCVLTQRPNNNNNNNYNSNNNNISVQFQFVFV